jgi:hypothetical protein
MLRASPLALHPSSRAGSTIRWRFVLATLTTLCLLVAPGHIAAQDDTTAYSDAQMGASLSAVHRMRALSQLIVFFRAARRVLGGGGRWRGWGAGVGEGRVSNEVVPNDPLRQRWWSNTRPLLLSTELCKQYGADPLNVALLTEQSATLTAQGATECTPEKLAADGGLGPCLAQLGLFGYELQGTRSCFQSWCFAARGHVITTSSVTAQRPPPKLSG